MSQDIKRGQLRSVVRTMRPYMMITFLLSALINLFALGSSIYMMLVYDTVLPSSSIVTLYGLLLLFTVVLIFHGLMEVVRARILDDLARDFGEKLSQLNDKARWKMAMQGPQAAMRPVEDLDIIQRFMASPGPSAFLDAPWIIIFVSLLFLLHPWLGGVTVLGVLILLALTYYTERKVNSRLAGLEEKRMRRRAILERNANNAQVIRALGMTRDADKQWHEVDVHFQDESSDVNAIVSRSRMIGRVFRLFLQSAVLTVGAILVIDGKASAGVIFASSIMAGRALAPIDQAIANWRGFASARNAWGKLDQVMSAAANLQDHFVQLPPPKSKIVIDRVAAVAGGSNQVILTDVGFEAQAGDVIGIIGPSGSGKSTLLRAIAGIWPLARGSIRFDDASIDQWSPDTLGQHVGYLPQEMGLMDGSVGENISRLSAQANSQAILAAAESAGVHKLIVNLPNGYDTVIGASGGALSVGQRQRIALARALYGEPFLLLLDEPNSNLDPEGQTALVQAIEAARARGAVTLLVTHQAHILNITSKILVLRGGKVALWGERDKVLAELNQNARATSVQPNEAVAG